VKFELIIFDKTSKFVDELKPSQPLALPVVSNIHRHFRKLGSNHFALR